jgi:hypothetical protein
MTFRLSQTAASSMLQGVDEQLVATVKLAIAVAKIDFGVICGLRTMEEQRVLVDKGASKTMRSKHLDGKAVDLMAYIGSRAFLGAEPLRRHRRRHERSRCRDWGGAALGCRVAHPTTFVSGTVRWKTP